MKEVISISITKQLGLIRQLAVTANNVANSETPGFRREIMIYQALKVKSPEGEVVSYPNDITTVIDLSESGLINTGNPMDTAIIGKGFYKVNTPAGIRFTRCGRFKIDENGILVTANNYPISSDSGDIIQIPTGSDVSINEIGQLISQGSVIAQLGVFDFDHAHILQPVGGGLHISSEQEKIASNFKISVGAYETSNVSSVNEMVSLTETERYHSIIVNTMSIAEEMQNKAVKIFSGSAVR